MRLGGLLRRKRLRHPQGEQTVLGLLPEAVQRGAILGRVAHLVGNTRTSRCPSPR